MIEIKVPGFGALKFMHLVLDYNGTIACDGKLIAGVDERIRQLAQDLRIHVLTADTFGSVRESLSQLPCIVSIIPGENQAEAKADYVADLGAENCVCVGNGRNDAVMLAAARLGIAVVQTEGCAGAAIMHADVLVRGILDALDLLLHPLRLVATLRS